MDKNPSSVNLYCYSIDVKTGKIDSNTAKASGYTDDVEYVSYEDGRVYAESLVSMDEARRLVKEYCQRFVSAIQKIECSTHVECHCMCHGMPWNAHDQMRTQHIMACCHDCSVCGARNIVK